MTQFSRLESGNALREQIRMALGLEPSVESVYIIGTNSDLDGSEDVLIWPPGTAYTLPTAAAQINCSSSSASDTTQTLTVYYLTDAYVEKTATVTLAGQTETAVTGASDVFRIQKCTVSAACAGNVWIYLDDTVTAGVPQTDTKKLGYIPATYMGTRQALYTIPAAHYGLLLEVTAAIGASATAKSYDVHCYSKTGTAAATLLTAITPVSSGLSEITREFVVPRLIQPGTDVYAKSENASANDCVVSCEIELMLIPQKYVETI